MPVDVPSSGQLCLRLPENFCPLVESQIKGLISFKGG